MVQVTRCRLVRLIILHAELEPDALYSALEVTMNSNLTFL